MVTDASDTPYVFLFYASANRDRALTIAARLEQAGIDVWIDRRAIPGRRAGRRKWYFLAGSRSADIARWEESDWLSGLTQDR